MGHYLSNKKLYCEIIVSKGKGKLTPRAKEMFILLADRTIRKKPYRNEDDRNDCYQSGLFDLFESWYKFDERKSRNAFAYITEIFKRGAAKGMNELYKKKGDMDNNIKVFSIDRSNDGEGMHNI